MHRRTLLKLSVTSGAVLAFAGAGTALFYESAWRADQLTAPGRDVFGAVARGVLDGSLPAGERAQRDALASHLERMNSTLRALAPSAQREIFDLLAVMATAPGRLAFAGLATDWPRADAAQIQSALRSMRTSRLALRRQAYHALRDLTHAAYFADSSTWKQLGYPGPLNVS